MGMKILIKMTSVAAPQLSFYKVIRKGRRSQRVDPVHHPTVDHQLLQLLLMVHLTLLLLLSASLVRTDQETPSKSKKRPASSAKKGATGEEGSPASKKPRVSSAPSSVGTGGGSRTSTPTPTGSEEGPQGITEEAVRRYLTRKPMTSKDLLQKFKSKRTGLSNDETVKKIAAIVRKLQPEQKTIKGKTLPVTQTAQLRMESNLVPRVSLELLGTGERETLERGWMKRV
ncbi:hypothetical protein OS493_015407 [Desmophyllum pertusum]|uniref:Transcription initiation factor IIF subunit alpha n=1 Tax=Desmophyllum pertusum TaxID=174260 RepID=A0A9W9Z0L1_9CNID|nr:hypothetical protein OS493_015407 [Desmophyllum pertusum]